MTIDILAEIKSISAKKREKNILPDHVLSSELFSKIIDEAKKELNALCAEGKIRYGKTINEVWLKANEVE